jgi:hypothetical protein
MAIHFRLCILLNLISGTMLFAQGTSEVELQPSEKNAIATFVSSIKQQSRIFNGPTYYTYGANVGGSAIFLDTTLIRGKLVYEHEVYDGVPLMYDLYIDRLVSTNGRVAFSFVSEKVNDFYIGSRHFRYMDMSAYNTPVVNGFFEVAYDGRYKVLIKRSKKLKFSTNAEMPYYFKSTDEYFLLKDNQLFKIDSENAVISLFNDKKNELKRYLATEKIKFNRDPSKALVALITYYESLSK